MFKGIKIRIYPNKRQKELLAKTFGCCRLIYNRGLALRKAAYEVTKESIGYKETNAVLTSLKKEEDFAFLKEVDSMALQQSLRDLDKAYQNFFRTKQGFPKFKSKHNHHNTSGNQICKISILTLNINKRPTEGRSESYACGVYVRRNFEKFKTRNRTMKQESH